MNAANRWRWCNKKETPGGKMIHYREDAYGNAVVTSACKQNEKAHVSLVYSIRQNLLYLYQFNIVRFFTGITGKYGILQYVLYMS